MTLREKIGQITQLAVGYRSYEKRNEFPEFSDEWKNAVEYYGGVGAISGVFRADPWTKKFYGTGLELQEREAFANRMQRWAMEHSRLKMPVLIEMEASHGLQALGSVLYPTGLCSGASFNPALYEQIMQRCGRETLLSGAHITWVTVIDVARDPRWGRSEECFGEDPCHASRFARSAMRGVKAGGALVCAKHFLGSGNGSGGINAFNCNLPERELREIHLPTAKAAIEAGADFVMVAYNTIDGEPLHLSHRYLTQLLREELGFDGIIISDGVALLQAARRLQISPEKTATLALQAGIDLSLADEGCFTTLEETVKESPALMARIDEACIRILEKKFQMGLFDDPFVPEGRVHAYTASGDGERLAYQMAAEAMTLVRNEGSVLPLEPSCKLCVVGENADDIYYLLGDYTSERLPHEGKTLRQAIGERFPNAVYAKGWDFRGNADFEEVRRAAENCDIICLCMGGSSVRNFNAKYLNNGAVENSEDFMDCGEGCDVADLSLPRNQIELLKQLKTLNKPIVALMVMGRAYVLTPVLQLADSVLIAWYPGQEGAKAAADVLLGRVNPSGRLPVSLPADSACLPVCYNERDDNRHYVNQPAPVLLPFGYGMSYTTFAYANAAAEMVGNQIIIRVDVTNTGERDGKEVVQAYVHRYFDCVLSRQKELVDFEKVFVKAHETIRVTLGVNVQALEDCLTHALPYALDVFVGGNPLALSHINLTLQKV